MDLRELVEELKRQRENSLDVICWDEDIEAIPDKDFGILLRVSGKGAWPLAEWLISNYLRSLRYLRDTMIG